VTLAARAPEASLENNANNPTPPGRREPRYELRRLLWDVSGLRRIKGCGRGRRAEFVGVRHSPGHGAGFSGLVTCGSVWACPVCSAKILARRSLELGVGLLSWENSGGQLVMGTLTMRHNRGHSLVQEWDALAKSWDSILRSRVWKKWLTRLGSPGLIRVVEVTYGENGWHVHLHFVLLVADSVFADSVDAFGSWVTAKWSRGLEASGMPGALSAGQDVHMVEGVTAASELGEYLAKSTAYGVADSLGRELMGSWSKEARGFHSTVPAWRIAEEFGQTGEAILLDRWSEYERGSKGRRQSTWSRGLRDLLGLNDEKSDEEIAEEVHGDEDLVRITAAGWETAWRSHVPTCRILAAVETGGTAGLRAYLTDNGIEFTEVA
jgi:hypothetical protein